MIQAMAHPGTVGADEAEYERKCWSKTFYPAAEASS